MSFTKRALFAANLDSFHKRFHIPYIKNLQDKGYEVDLVSKGSETSISGAKKYNIAFARTPFSLINIKSFFKIRRLISSKKYDIIYFSTPIIGAFGRVALLGLDHGRVIYSAHGFNFYEGNSKLSNFVYSRIEGILAKLTDCVFTMNREDFAACKKYKIRPKELYNVDGVGIDTHAFTVPSYERKMQLRKQYNYDEKDFILIYPAELTKRKNQGLLISIVAELVRKYSNVKLLLVGSGINEPIYKQLSSELDLTDYVHFLGYRNDVVNLLQMSDVLFASSKNEGLPVNIIEALATGLPVVATDTRGQNDLIQDGYNGFLFDMNQPMAAVEKICKLIDDINLYNSMRKNAAKSAQRYDIINVLPQYDKIFQI